MVVLVMTKVRACSPILRIQSLMSTIVSWAFDGGRGKKWHHAEGKDYGSSTRINDLVGCMIDCDRRAISFFLNGQSLGA